MESKRHHTRALKKEKTYYMYVLQCDDKNQSYYCGISTDPQRRLKEHNQSKKGAKYTRSRRPVRLMFVQECESKSDALKKEAAFKKLSRSQKLVYMCDVIEAGMLAQAAASEINQVDQVQDTNKKVDNKTKPGD